MTFETFLDFAKLHFLAGKHRPIKRAFGGPDVDYCCPITAGILEYYPQHDWSQGYTKAVSELTKVTSGEMWSFIRGYDGILINDKTDIKFYNYGVEFSKWLEQEDLYDGNLDSSTNR